VPELCESEADEFGEECSVTEAVCDRGCGGCSGECRRKRMG
jgi:hypothetical protein